MKSFTPLEDLGLADDRPTILVSGIFADVTPEIATVDLFDGRTGMVTRTDWLPSKAWKVGDRHWFEVIDNGPRPILTLVRPTVVQLVLEGIVPELRTGQVRIMGVARLPGVRTKIGVATTDPTVDAVETFVGQRASRVNTYRDHMGGERLDVVAWHSDPAVYLTNGLGQRVLDVTDTDGHLVITVPDHGYAAATGGGGVNARLLHELTGVPFTIVPATLA